MRDGGMFGYLGRAAGWKPAVTVPKNLRLVWQLDVTTANARV